jgi:hypothetical protein
MAVKLAVCWADWTAKRKVVEMVECSVALWVYY